MPSDIEISNSDSSILNTKITLNPEIITNIKPTPERVVLYIGIRNIFAILGFAPLGHLR
jgi:hypothetical protein